MASMRPVMSSKASRRSISFSVSGLVTAKFSRAPKSSAVAGLSSAIFKASRRSCASGLASSLKASMRSPQHCSTSSARSRSKLHSAPAARPRVRQCRSCGRSTDTRRGTSGMILKAITSEGHHKATKALRLELAQRRPRQHEVAQAANSQLDRARLEPHSERKQLFFAPPHALHEVFHGVLRVQLHAIRRLLGLIFEAFRKKILLPATAHQLHQALQVLRIACRELRHHLAADGALRPQEEQLEDLRSPCLHVQQGPDVSQGRCREAAMVLAALRDHFQDLKRHFMAMVIM